MLTHQLRLQKPIEVDAVLPELENLTLSEKEFNDMTLAEQKNYEIHRNLLKAVILLADSKSVPGEDINKIFKQMEEWVSTTLQSVSNDSKVFEETVIFLSSSSSANTKRLVPSWRYLHSSFLLLETVKALSVTISLAETAAKRLPKTGAKPSKEAYQGLKEYVIKLHEAVKSNTRTLRGNVMGSGVLGVLTDLIFHQSEEEGATSDTSSELCSELEQTLDSSAVEIFCGELMESWEEGLGGILSLK